MHCVPFCSALLDSCWKLLHSNLQCIHNVLIHQNNQQPARPQENAACQFLWSEFVEQDCKADENLFRKQCIHEQKSASSATSSSVSSSTSFNNNPTTSTCWRRASHKFIMRLEQTVVLLFLGVGQPKTWVELYKCYITKTTILSNGQKKAFLLDDIGIFFDQHTATR